MEELGKLPEAIVSRKQIVDVETGALRYGESKVTPFTLFREDRGYMLFLNKRNVRTFPDVDFPEDFTMTDIARLFLLSRQIIGNTNMIGKRTRNGYRPMTPAEMAEIAQMPYRRFVTWLNRMIRAGMIAKVRIKTEGEEVTQYYMNPLYFFSDKYLPLNLYLLFQRQLDRYLPEWVRHRFAEMKRELEEKEARA